LTLLSYWKADTCRGRRRECRRDRMPHLRNGFTPTLPLEPLGWGCACARRIKSPQALPCRVICQFQ
jgi:hypothetical protein